MQVAQRSLRRYLAIVRFKISRVLIFRTEMVIWILLSFLPFAILFLIWQELYAGQTSVNGYTLSQITTYYLIGSLISNLTDVHFESWRSEEIRLGKIDQYLCKPYHYLTEVLVGETVGKTIYFLLFLLPYAGFIIWSLNGLPLSLTLISLQGILPFCILLVWAYALQWCFGALITLLTFWFEGAQGIEHFKWLIITMLSGALMPLEFLPNWLQTITQALPLKYLYAVPINVLLGRTSLQLSDVITMLLTLAVAYLAVRVVWRRGVATYTSAGG